MKIIAFSGMPGAGKSLAAQYSKELGFEILRVGDLTDQELKKRGLEVNEQNERLVREALREEFGMDVYAQKVSERIDSGKFEKVFLDGIRSYEEFLYLKNKYKGNFVSIALLASAKTRHVRLMDRKIRPLSGPECVHRDKAEIENLNQADTIVMSDYFIINEGSEKELKENIKPVLERFK